LFPVEILENLPSNLELVLLKMLIVKFMDLLGVFLVEGVAYCATMGDFCLFLVFAPTLVHYLQVDAGLNVLS